MISSKKAFVLYDAIVSIVLLTGSVLFFNQVFVINSQQNIKAQEKSIVINALYYGVDKNYATTKYNDVDLFIEKGEYCGQKGEIKICIIK